MTTLLMAVLFCNVKNYGVVYNAIVYTDTSATKQLEDIMRLPQQAFLRYDAVTMSNKMHYWLKIQIVLNDTTPSKLLWKAGKTDYAYLYQTDSNGKITTQQSGMWIPQDQKTIPYNFNQLQFLLQKPDNDTLVVWLHVYNTSGFVPEVKFDFIDYEIFSQQRHKEVAERNIMQGIFQGALWILILYNLLIFLIYRDKSYLYYILYMFVLSGYLLTIFGFFETTWLGNFPLLHFYGLAFTSVSSVIFYAAFLQTFLNLRHTQPTLYKWLTVIIIIESISIARAVILLTFTDNIHVSIMFGNIADLLSYLIVAVVLVQLYRKRLLLSNYVVGGTVLLLASAIFFASFELFFFRPFQTAYVLEAGMMAQVLVYSIGLGKRMELNEQEKRVAQEQLIAQLRENQALQNKVNRELETKVRERTAEIEQQKEELRAQTEYLQDANQKITQQHHLIEEKSQQVTAGITYASRIQQVILPSVENIKQSLPDFFLFYRPRDIVSGDFYWYAQADNYYILACADCTGHGVPGALMSMLGASILNHLVHQRHLLQPGEILNQLHASVRQYLKQASTSNRDGMDIGICLIDSEKNQIVFAGARTPLVYVHNNEATVVKGYKHSIGGHVLEEERVFEQQTVDIPSGAMIYLCSDGFQDQFGGERKNKYFSKQLRDFMQGIAHLSGTEQEQRFAAEFDAWRGNLPQTDDVLVLGFRF